MELVCGGSDPAACAAGLSLELNPIISKYAIIVGGFLRQSKFYWSDICTIDIKIVTSSLTSPCSVLMEGRVRRFLCHQGLNWGRPLGMTPVSPDACVPAPGGGVGLFHVGQIQVPQVFQCQEGGGHTRQPSVSQLQCSVQCAMCSAVQGYLFFT